MIVLDTTVLVYAVGGDHPLRQPAAALVAAIGDGQVTATTSVEVIQEFTHIRARRRSREDAASLATAAITLLAPLTAITTADLEAGLRLFEQHEELGCFDAVLAAVTRRLGARLVSADMAFDAALGPDFLALSDAPAALLPGA